MKRLVSQSQPSMVSVISMIHHSPWISYRITVIRNTVDLKLNQTGPAKNFQNISVEIQSWIDQIGRRSKHPNVSHFWGAGISLWHPATNSGSNGASWDTKIHQPCRHVISLCKTNLHLQYDLRSCFWHPKAVYPMVVVEKIDSFIFIGERGVSFHCYIILGIYVYIYIILGIYVYPPTPR